MHKSYFDSLTLVTNRTNELVSDIVSFHLSPSLLVIEVVFEEGLLDCV